MPEYFMRICIDEASDNVAIAHARVLRQRVTELSPASLNGPSATGAGGKNRVCSPYAQHSD